MQHTQRCAQSHWIEQEVSFAAAVVNATAGALTLHLLTPLTGRQEKNPRLHKSEYLFFITGAHAHPPARLPRSLALTWSCVLRKTRVSATGYTFTKQ